MTDTDDMLRQICDNHTAHLRRCETAAIARHIHMLLAGWPMRPDAAYDEDPHPRAPLLILLGYHGRYQVTIEPLE